MCLGKQATYTGNPAPYALDNSETAVKTTVDGTEAKSSTSATPGTPTTTTKPQMFSDSSGTALHLLEIGNPNVSRK